MGPLYNYFDVDWYAKILRCPTCGWSGKKHEANIAVNQNFAYTEVICPQCKVLFPPTLAFILHPTIEEMRVNIDKPGVREELERIARIQQEMNTS